MAHVLVRAADLADGTLTRLRVQMGTLPHRVIDRDTAIAWLKDHHSLIPTLHGRELPALRLLTLDEEAGTYAIRADGQEAEGDQIPSLPAVDG